MRIKLDFIYFFPKLVITYIILYIIICSTFTKQSFILLYRSTALLHIGKYRYKAHVLVNPNSTQSE